MARRQVGRCRECAAVWGLKDKGGGMRGTACISLPLCPLVLPVTLGCRQDRALGLKETKSWVLECLVVGARNKVRFGNEFGLCWITV